MKTRASTAITHQNSEFELYFSSDNAGAAVGNFYVTIFELVFSDKVLEAPGKKMVPKKFQKYDTLNVEIVECKNENENEFDFDVNSN